MLLADSGLDAVAPKFLDRTQYNATHIRQMIVSGENWQKLVPKAVVKFLDQINGKNRLKVISKSDTKPTEH
jgi:nicotinamide-nucleotide adenylyltransferase